METIGKRTTTSGGETMDSMLLSTTTEPSCRETFPTVISPSSIDFQSDGQRSCSTVHSTTLRGTGEEGRGGTRNDDENKTEILTTPSTIATGESAGNERWLNSGGGCEQGDRKDTCGTKSLVETTHSQVSEIKENGSLQTTSETKTTTTKNNLNYSDQQSTLSTHFKNNNDIEEEEEGNQEEHSETPVPNFCVSGDDDSCVTVVVGPLNSNGVSYFTESLSNESTIDGNQDGGCCDGTENGSGPISVQSSEDLDMKLSLVSWYSEPDESSRDCCKNKNLISRSITSSSTTTGTSSRLKSCNDRSDEKENKTPMRPKGSGNVHLKLANQTQSQRLKMHVQLFNQNGSPASVEDGNCKVGGSGSDGHASKKMECPRCARRSKSGTTTPAAPSKTPRRVVQSSKSTQELKKPIKSILKSDSRGSGSRSGSGSEKQSSMDSLGSASGISCVMTRSDGGSASCGGGRTKFNFSSPEDKLSKLKRIEKYATLRLKKPRVRPLEFGGTSGDDTDEVPCRHQNHNYHHGHKNGIGSPGVPSESMTKSMSFLEKSTTMSTTCGGDCSNSNNNNNNSTLKRQGSLRIRKPSPMWEPSSTRTSALRMQKMQEAKNKTSGTKFFSGGNHHHNNSGSNHSGSGESIHMQPTHSNSHLHGVPNSSNNTGTTTTNGCSSSNASHSVTNGLNSNCHCTNHRLRQQPQTNKDKQQHVGAKIFSKLSSAVGQTASSAMKRVRQERAMQTDPVSIVSSLEDGQSPTISPVPTIDQETDETEQIKNMEILAQRYRNTALRFQHEYEKSEQKNRQLIKQLQEAQSESSEMIDFLQAEKSTLAESLVEVENEGKKLKDEVDSLKKDSQARCSTLVRLSEQHKQEALKAQALLNRLEVQSNAKINKKSVEMTEAALAIQQTRQRIVILIEKLLKTYKVPHELLASAMVSSPSPGTKLEETELKSSLLLPLVMALMNVFPTNPPSSSSSKESHKNLLDEAPTGIIKPNDAPSSTVVTTVTVNNVMKLPTSTSPVVATTGTPTQSSTTVSNNLTQASSEPNLETDDMSNLSNSLQNLNQAILDREAAERLGLDDVGIISRVTAGLLEIHDGDHLSIKMEVDKLNRSLNKLVIVIRVIVIHCDKKVSGVTSNILQCLRIIDEDKIGAIPEMVNVQKSLEARNDGEMTYCKDNGSVVVVTGPTSNGHSHNI